MTAIKIINGMEVLRQKEKFLPKGAFDSYGCAYCVWRHKQECFHYDKETKLTVHQCNGICENVRWYILNLTPDYESNVTPYQWRLDVSAALAHRHILNTKMELDNANIELSMYEKENHFDGINYWKSKVNRLSREFEKFMNLITVADTQRAVKTVASHSIVEHKSGIPDYNKHMDRVKDVKSITIDAEVIKDDKK